MVARLTGTAALDELVHKGEVIYVPEVTTFEDEFDPMLRPPPIKTYSGRDILKTKTPHYAVEFDAGAFRALWEYVEIEAKHRFPTRGSLAGTAALLRALEALRASYWAANEPPAPEPVKPVKKASARKAAGGVKKPLPPATPAVKKIPTRVPLDAPLPRKTVATKLAAQPSVRKIVRRPRASSG